MGPPALQCTKLNSNSYLPRCKTFNFVLRYTSAFRVYLECTKKDNYKLHIIHVCYCMITSKYICLLIQLSSQEQLLEFLASTSHKLIFEGHEVTCPLIPYISLHLPEQRKLFQVHSDSLLRLVPDVMHEHHSSKNKELRQMYYIT